MSSAGWDYDSIRRTLDEFTGGSDASDPRARRRLRIVQAATDLFVRQGYRKTSMDEIASRAGVAKGTLYLYFGSKAELLVHAIAEEKKRIVVRLKPILAPEVPAEEKLRRWIAMAFVLVQEMPLVGRLMGGDREILAVMEDLPAGRGQEFSHMQVGFMARIVEEAARPGGLGRTEIEERSAVLVGLMYASGVFADARIRQGLTLERFGEVLADMIMDGLAGPPAAGPGAGSGGGR
jgi:AcrR family transcriptional regulator